MLLYYIIIILLLFAIILSSYNLYLSVKEYKNGNNIYNMSGGNMKRNKNGNNEGKQIMNKNEKRNFGGNNELNELERFIKNINFKFPQVGILNNNILNKYELKKFVYLDKTDGLHVNIILYDNKIYTVKNNEYKELKIDGGFYELKENKKISLLDGELYENNIYIFDACFINGIDIMKSNYINRMEEAKKLVESMTKNNIFIVKQYKEIIYDNFEQAKNIFNKIMNYVNTKDCNEEGINVDGVVFQLKEAPYISKDYIVYKLKRTIMNTIDFKLFYDDEKDIYRLYLIGSPNDYIFNRKYKPHIINDYHTDITHETRISEIYNKYSQGMLILFDNPYKEGCSIYNPNTEINDSTKLPKRMRKDAELLIKQIQQNKKQFHNKIIEMALDVNGWVPLRVREDKETPNGYKIGLSNCEMMFSPVSLNKSYFTKKTTMDENKIINPYHEINRVIRKYIIERCINKRFQGRKIKVLDLCGGRGADSLNLYRSGAYDICVVDADNVAITQYVNRVGTIKMQANKDKYENITKDYKENIKTSYLTINGRKFILCENNNELIKEILNISENNKQEKETKQETEKETKQENNSFRGYDVILMNYAVHYLCYSYDCLTALNKLVSALLANNGIFICSYFDGDKIYNDIMTSENKLLPVKTFNNIHIIDNEKEISEDNKKLFNDYKDAIWCNMALPTIDESGYREEPLVLKKFIEKIRFSETDEETLKNIEEFKPIKEIEKINKEKLTSIKNYENVIDYLRYIKVSMYSQK